MKLVTVVGARPQFIKAAVVSRQLRGAFPGVEERLIHTGQHYDEKMSALFFEEMVIPEPAYRLEVGSGSHGAMTGRMLERLEALLVAERPDWLLVYGDTNSTLAGALAAAKLQIPVAHVEAGLRSFNRAMPEEVNRILCDHCASLLFAPTEVAHANLRREGVPEERIERCGDVMLDAALFYRERSMARSSILKELGLEKGGYLLATIHRQENTDSPERLANLLAALSTLAEEWPVVLPLHPRTRKEIERLRSPLGSIVAIDPVGYLDMVQLESGARLILTDSGGVQREAFFFGVPSLILRDETEWVELIEGGYSQLVGASIEGVLAGYRAFEGGALHGDWSRPLYGRGDAARQIIERLIDAGD